MLVLDIPKSLVIFDVPGCASSLPRDGALQVEKDLLNGKADGGPVKNLLDSVPWLPAGGAGGVGVTSSCRVYSGLKGV